MDVHTLYMVPALADDDELVSVTVVDAAQDDGYSDFACIVEREKKIRVWREDEK